MGLVIKSEEKKKRNDEQLWNIVLNSMITVHQGVKEIFMDLHFSTDLSISVLVCKMVKKWNKQTWSAKMVLQHNTFI